MDFAFGNEDIRNAEGTDNDLQTWQVARSVKPLQESLPII